MTWNGISQLKLNPIFCCYMWISENKFVKSMWHSENKIP